VVPVEIGGYCPKNKMSFGVRKKQWNKKKVIEIKLTSIC